MNQYLAPEVKRNPLLRNSIFVVVALILVCLLAGLVFLSVQNKVTSSIPQDSLSKNIVEGQVIVSYGQSDGVGAMTAFNMVTKEQMQVSDIQGTYLNVLTQNFTVTSERKTELVEVYIKKNEDNTIVHTLVYHKRWKQSSAICSKYRDEGTIRHYL
jgi:uncharacterized membrane protein